VNQGKGCVKSLTLRHNLMMILEKVNSQPPKGGGFGGEVRAAGNPAGAAAIKDRRL